MDAFKSFPKRKLIECEACGDNIGILQLKIPRSCIDCAGTFCTECTVPVENAIFDRRCKQCQHLNSGRFDRNFLKEMRMKSIIAFLKRRRINYSGCADKNDLVDVVCEVYNLPTSTNATNSVPLFGMTTNDLPGSSTTSSRAATTAENTSTPIDHDVNPSFPPPTYSESVSGAASFPPPSTMEANESKTGEDAESFHNTETNKFRDLLRVNLSLIEDIEQIELLSVNQLKQLLAANHMQVPTGCKEKEDLRRLVRTLFIAEQRRLQQQLSDEGIQWENMCKICMSNEIDCVLLECGHLCVCLTCGKTLSECPICRALVVRAVRVFKS